MRMRGLWLISARKWKSLAAWRKLLLAGDRRMRSYQHQRQRQQKRRCKPTPLKPAHHHAPRSAVWVLLHLAKGPRLWQAAAARARAQAVHLQKHSMSWMLP